MIAEELRKRNVAEYLLYMWQVEDMIRANGFDVDKLADVSTSLESEKENLRKWYGELVDMMTAEGVRESGHLQINRNIIILMNDLHCRIMDSSGCSRYKGVYYGALPVIVGYRAKSGSLDKNELESCFEFLYGMWMLKLQGRDISDGTDDAFKRISAFIALLAAYYDKDKKGELDLDHEE